MDRSAEPRHLLLARQELRPEHSLSALGVQTIAWLARSQAEVDALVAAAVTANPCLSAGVPRRCRWCAGVVRGGCCFQCAGRRMSALQTRPDSVDDTRSELRRAARLEVPAALRPVVDAVVDALDEQGLLSAAAESNASQPFSRADWLRAVLAVRDAGPPGTACRDALAGLRAQAAWHATNGGPPLIRELLGEQLSRLTAGDLTGAALALGAPVADVERAARFIRTRLTPTPIGLRAADADRCPPDVVIHRDADGRLTAEVLGAGDLGLEIDRGGLQPGLPPAARAWWAERIAEASALLDLVDRRSGTLRRIATALVALQRDFILDGPAAHLPLTRSGLAEHLGLHPSTVTRAVADATAALPDGHVVPLAAFFGNAVGAQERLRALLNGPQPPRTDAEAVRLLAADGYEVARRTVAKYRRALSSL